MSAISSLLIKDGFSFTSKVFTLGWLIVFFISGVRAETGMTVAFFQMELDQRFVHHLSLEGNSTNCVKGFLEMFVVFWDISRNFHSVLDRLWLISSSCKTHLIRTISIGLIKSLTRRSPCTFVGGLHNLDIIKFQKNISSLFILYLNGCQSKTT